MPFSRRLPSSQTSHALAAKRFVLGSIAVLFGLAAQPCAARPLVKVGEQSAGPTPFIVQVRLDLDQTSLLNYVQFTVAPKPGSVTRPLSARYSKAYLTRRGFLKADKGFVKIPVFGLYANFTNSVTLVSGFINGSTQVNTVEIATGKYKGGIYKHPKVLQERSSAVDLSYDFVLMKSFSDGDSPKIIDTDGEVRWVGTAGTPSMEAIFFDNSFFVVEASGTALRRMELDGSYAQVADYAASGVKDFHHNFDFGKSGILTDYDTANYLESNIMEVDPAGAVLHSWDMADIITKAMVAGGDDPTQFVAAAGTQVDWFHNNCVAYRSSDDSLVVSSRENFVLGLDYETGAIKWIFGDPTKQWHQFPSLARYALSAPAGTDYPIGQHALSFFNDRLLLFDNGYYSADHTPKGENRSYSAPRKYKLDLTARTATEIWDYEAGQAIYSPITSSVYEDRPDNYLIDYATEGPYLEARLIGLSPGGAKVFDYEFTELQTAATAWNAVVLHLENLVFD